MKLTSCSNSVELSPESHGLTSQVTRNTSVHHSRQNLYRFDIKLNDSFHKWLIKILMHKTKWCDFKWSTLVSPSLILTLHDHIHCISSWNCYHLLLKEKEDGAASKLYSHRKELNDNKFNTIEKIITGL